jgi:chromosome segregation ATPase
MFIISRDPQYDLSIKLNIDNNFGTKYSNFVAIVQSMENYFTASRQNTKYTSILNVKELININELLKYNQEQLLTFTELLIVISSICYNKDTYIDILQNNIDSTVEYYFNIVEKYIVLEADTSIVSNNMTSNDNSSILLPTPNNGPRLTRVIKRFSCMGSNDPEGMSKMIQQNDRLKTKIDYLEKEKENMGRSMAEYQNRISELQSENDTLIKDNKTVKEKLENSRVELDILKSNNAKYLEANEDYLKEIIIINNLKNVILQKDVEIEEITKESDKMLKNYTDQITILNEKINDYEEKQKETRQLKNEMEKLKVKNKELMTVKDKFVDYDELRTGLDKSKSIIDGLNREKNNMMTQIETLNNELMSNKERIIQFEFEKKKIEYDSGELQKQVHRLENLRQSDYDNLKRTSANLNSASKALVEVEELSFDKFKHEHSQIDILEREFYEVRREKEELEEEVRQQNNLITSLNLEKKKLLTKIDESKTNFDNKVADFEKLTMEKDKLKIEKERLELELTRSTFDLVKENKQLTEQLQLLNDKLEESNVHRNNLVKDLESLREQYINSNNLCDRLLNEKKELINDTQALRNEINDLKDEYSEQSKFKY